ncbi:fatty acid--CoA ligase [soil metagenome]
MTFSLDGMLTEIAASTPQAPAVTLDDLTLTFAELEARSAQLANAMLVRGVVPGGRVAVLARNSPAYYEIVFACAKVGAVMVGLNWRLSARELEAIIADAAPQLAFADKEFVANLHADVQFIETGSDYEAFIAEQDATTSAHSTDPHATVVQLYSSGTTGLPKGILISHDNLSPSAHAGEHLYGMSEASVNLVPSPLFHIGGLGYSLTAMTRGGHTVLVSEASAGHLLKVIETLRVTHTFLVPSLIQSLVDSEEIASSDLSSMEFVAYGGAPMSPSLMRKATETIGSGFIAVYGMTETSGTVIAMLPEHIAAMTPELLKSIGKPLPWMGEAIVVDPGSLEVCEPDQVGEIWVRSRQVTDGYWHNDEATAEAIRSDGWLRTGDAAYCDQHGYFYLHDRIKDMIISGGENVYPAEVESVLVEHEAIAECAVIGVPDKRWGETVKAIVVLREGVDIDAQTLIAFCRANLAHYKCPTSVDFEKELPKNASGKVLKKKLRQLFASDVSV